MNQIPMALQRGRILLPRVGELLIFVKRFYDKEVHFILQYFDR